MNKNIFSRKRFADFFPVELICFNKKPLLCSLLMLGIITLMAVLQSMDINFEYFKVMGYDLTLKALVNIYLWMLFFFGCASASIMWWEMRKKEGRLYSLMNPASTLEKYLVKFTVYIVSFLIVFVICVCVAETVRYLIFSRVYHSDYIRPLYLSFSYPKEIVDEIWQVSSSVDHPWPFFFCQYLCIQSFFVLGSVIWPNRSFVKTFLVFGGVSALIIFIASQTGIYLSEDKWGGPVMQWLKLNSYAIFYVFTTFVTLANWTLAYFRYRETDIITTKR